MYTDILVPLGDASPSGAVAVAVVRTGHIAMQPSAIKHRTGY